MAVRYETPYSDPHATDLLVTTDRLVQQERLYPGQLLPLLRLMGVGAVVSGTDDDLVRSGAVDPASAAATLAGQGLGRPSRSYGPVRTLPAPRGSLAAPQPEPQVRRYDLRTGRGLVHVEPIGPATVVDGGAEGVAALAAFGALPADRPLLYAGDLSADELRREAAGGASVVVSDSNRRRRFLPEFTEQNLGATAGEADRLNDNWAQIDPFPDKGTDAQTVAVLQGAKYVAAPAQGGLLEFPEHTPSKAFDGDPSTVWAADRYRQAADRWIEIGFAAPRDVPYVDLQPIRDPYGIEREVDVNGVRAKLGPGITRVRLDQRGIRRVRVTLTKVDQPPGDLRGSGGFREIRIPGVRVRRLLRTPLVAGRALAGRDLSRTGLTYLFERDTADAPFRRNSRIGSPLLERPQDREDPEQVIDRALFAPATRRYGVDARVQAAPDAPDAALDRLVGLRGGEIVHVVGPLRRDGGHPRLERLRRAARHRLDRPLGAPVGRLALDRLVGAADPDALDAAPAPRPEPGAPPDGRARLVARRPDAAPCASAPAAPSPSRGPSAPAPSASRSCRPRSRRGSRAVSAPCAPWASAPSRHPGSPRSPCRAAGRCARPAAASRPTSAAAGSRCGREGTVADVLAGRPLRASGCDGAVTMGQGIQRCGSPPGRSPSTCCACARPRRSRRPRRPAAAASSIPATSPTAPCAMRAWRSPGRPGSCSARASRRAGARRATGASSARRGWSTATRTAGGPRPTAAT